MVMLLFSSENLSKIMKDSFWEFRPYKTPLSLDNSAEVRGKVVDKEVESILRVIAKRSKPIGAVVKKPSLMSKVAFLAMANNDPKVDSTCLVTWSNSSMVAAGMVR